jgi:hypothetical protein
MKVEKLFEIEGASQEFCEAPQLVRMGKGMILKYDKEDKESENGEYVLTGITFKEVIACKITKEVCEELYMIKAYDAVSVVKDSKWIMEVEKA